MTNLQIKRANYIASETDALYHEAALLLGLSDSAMRVLYTLYEEGGSCLTSTVYKRCGITRQTIHSALRKLEREGVVVLHADKGRNKRLTLTPLGQRVAVEKVQPLMDMENEVFSCWTEEELELYLRLSQRYLDDFGAKVAALREGAEA